MELLEMPLDALVLHLYSLPIIAACSVWTWVAVLTAAVSVWGIRAVGYRKDATASASPESTTPKLSVEAQKVPEPSPEEDHRKAAEPIHVLGSPSCHAEEVSTPKARFTAYYHAPESFGADDVEMHREEEEEEKEEELVIKSAGCVERRMTAPSPWMVVSRRGPRGDLGWYRYQDLTVLSGSVVRLWDRQDRWLTAMPRSPAVSPTSF